MGVHRVRVSGGADPMFPPQPARLSTLPPSPEEARGLWVGMTPCPLLPGSRLSKVYSQSTLSLSTVANEAPNNLGVKRPMSR